MNDRRVFHDSCEAKDKCRSLEYFISHDNSILIHMVNNDAVVFGIPIREIMY